jgi:hypothetical protein
MLVGMSEKYRKPLRSQAGPSVNMKRCERLSRIARESSRMISLSALVAIVSASARVVSGAPKIIAAEAAVNLVCL